MLNLIRSDFYRIFKSKLFYTCLAFDLLFTILGNLRSLSSYMHISWHVMFSLVCTIHMVIFPVFVCRYITSDFRNSIIKNLSIRHDRCIIYISKFIVSYLVTLIIGIASILSFFIFNLILRKESEESGSSFSMVKELSPDFSNIIFLTLLLYLAYISIYTMISFVLRRGGASVAISLVFPFILTPIFSIVHLFSPKFYLNYLAKWNLPLPAQMIQDMLQNTTSDFGYLKTVFLSYIFLSSAIGVYTFFRRDLK